MSRQIALIGAILGLCWLFAWDRKRGLNVSWSTWVPLLWLVIVGSKAPSSWFGADPDSAEGSPLDRFIFFGFYCECYFFCLGMFNNIMKYLLLIIFTFLLV